MGISTDRPLAVGTARANDELGRLPFANAAANALLAAARGTGFVVSVEGEWGSGKTSTLAIIEEVLSAQADKPIIVHFNPWLIGDRDALIRFFFQAMGEKVKTSDHGADAKKAAKAIKNYAKVFDALKLLPGAHGIADVIKNVMLSVADSAEGFANEKELDLEGKRRKLEKALLELNSRIIVFIDDVDRLLPGEVIEIVRIIKSVGDLPNVGYLVAWDSDYVKKSLEMGQVPKSFSYLDKIVQVRLPLPAITELARQKLLTKAMDLLPSAAKASYFPGAEDRLGEIYRHGLQRLLEQPRDIHRMMNTLLVIEPTIRGEVVLSDLLGLACIMTKAPSVYERLRKEPHFFQGSLDYRQYFSNDKARKKHFLEVTSAMWAELQNPEAVKGLVYFLFPALATACGEFVIRGSSPTWGTVSEPDRLALVLAFDLASTSVSLVAARKFIAEPDARSSIVQDFDHDSYVDFIEALGNLGSFLDSRQESLDLERLLLDMSRLVDSPALADTLARREGLSFSRPEGTASTAIEKILTGQQDPTVRTSFLKTVMKDPGAMTFRAEVISDSLSSRSTDRSVVVPSSMIRTEVARLANDAKRKVEDGQFWTLCNPSRIIWTIMRNGSRSACQSLFKAIQKAEPTLDVFAMIFLRHSFSSDGGQSYGLPDTSLVEKLVPLKVLQAHARARLKDGEVEYPLRAAWRSVVEQKYILGQDGSEVMH